MCKFCESIIDTTKDIYLASRNRLGKDNSCEIYDYDMEKSVQEIIDNISNN
ncbi:hypothetical protein NQ830_12240 [Clostridioides difficile]|uniref:hypothetical protein n=1 Tax=Clostridioides difficile TaxID=1496 RepID=UPI00038CE056|nr:hypothetical protein [Clostridioides difficile]EQJ88680.1 hypothetical protein QUC_3315 [Clostridioides difficile P50]MCO8835428.1 hypothetical protein [Clostridioides difficile]MCR1410100.1 hypothetical protein [Clostridioides difficile]MCR1421089.1 hypothetical protein [Clostridioides difficile]MDI0326382.1 hypothetical protein [Clostridioides difficile]